MHYQRRLRTYLALATSFLVLGLGNLIVGHSKARSYSQQLHAIRHHSPPIEDPSALMDEIPSAPGFPEIRSNPGIKERERLVARLNYYRLATMGGKCFLAIALLFSFLFLLSIRQPRSPAQSIKQ